MCLYRKMDVQSPGRFINWNFSLNDWQTALGITCISNSNGTLDCFTTIPLISYYTALCVLWQFCTMLPIAFLYNGHSNKVLLFSLWSFCFFVVLDFRQILLVCYAQPGQHKMVGPNPQTWLPFAGCINPSRFGYPPMQCCDWECKCNIAFCYNSVYEDGEKATASFVCSYYRSRMFIFLYLVYLEISQSETNTVKLLHYTPSE